MSSTESAGGADEDNSSPPELKSGGCSDAKPKRSIGHCGYCGQVGHNRLTCYVYKQERFAKWKAAQAAGVESTAGTRRTAKKAKRN